MELPLEILFINTSMVTTIPVAVAPIDEKFCMMIRVRPGCVFSHFGGGAPRGSPKSKIFPPRMAGVVFC